MRYGTGYRNTGYEAENEGEPVPNAPYATVPYSLFAVPDSRFPIPDSRFPIPDSLLPTPLSKLP
ncbi:hypothetical protein [Moorena producens]|uniref:hypothetical protein n=1 Tax=Moorena producens TaxID=1155739 RepID=UPI003C7820E7